MKQPEELNTTLKLYYEREGFTYISDELRKKLYKMADRIVEEYLCKSDITVEYISRATEESQDDILVMRLKSNQQSK